jgi:polyhydroxybutyrate depolymerase
MLHGGGGTALQAERTFGWNDLADRDGFLVCYPEGGTARGTSTTSASCSRSSTNW